MQQTDLKHLQDELLSHIRSLKSLGVEDEHYGVFLTPLVLSKLPEEVRLERARGSEGKEGNLEYLLQFLSTEIERRDRSGSYCQLGQAGQAAVAPVAPRQWSQRQPSRRPGGLPDGRPAGAAGGFRPERKPAAAAALQASTEAICGLCGARHPTDKCGELLKLSPRDRFERIKQARLCFCCLTSGHLARSCSVRCKKCQGRHHAVCCLKEEAPSVSMGQAGAESQVGGHLGSHVPKSDEGVSLSSHSEGEHVLLPTATVQVLGSDGKPVSAKLIMDTGSDRSFVSERLLKKVKGTWKGTVEMTYAAFGGGKSDGVYDKFQLQLTSSNVSLPEYGTDWISPRDS